MRSIAAHTLPKRPLEGKLPRIGWRLLKKFIMKMMMASKGIIYSFYTV